MACEKHLRTRLVIVSLSLGALAIASAKTGRNSASRALTENLSARTCAADELLLLTKNLHRLLQSRKMFHHSTTTSKLYFFPVSMRGVCSIRLKCETVSFVFLLRAQTSQE